MMHYNKTKCMKSFLLGQEQKKLNPFYFFKYMMLEISAFIPCLIIKAVQTNNELFIKLLSVLLSTDIKDAEVMKNSNERINAYLKMLVVMLFQIVFDGEIYGSSEEYRADGATPQTVVFLHVPSGCHGFQHVSVIFQCQYIT